MFVLNEITRKKDDAYIQKCINAFKTGESGSQPYAMPPLQTIAVLKENQSNETPTKKLKRIRRRAKI